MKLQEARFVMFLIQVLRKIKHKKEYDAYEYIISDSKKDGDRTMFCRRYHLCKKPIEGPVSKLVWKGVGEPLPGSTCFTLLALQQELSEELFSKFILRLAAEKIQCSKKAKGNYWAWEQDPILDVKILYAHILRSLAKKREQTPIPTQPTEVEKAA